jgi:hypothetical protein
MFVKFFKIIDYMKFKANQIYLKKTKIIQDVMSIHYPKKLISKNICMTIILGGLSVLSALVVDR